MSSIYIDEIIFNFKIAIIITNTYKFIEKINKKFKIIIK